MADDIIIKGARTHNLKDVSCAVPRGKLTVITGVSGSGKSTLAFDTLYAEGQRRYVESMSAYARQFLEKLSRPEVDHIEGIPPAIALEQHNRVTGARSTVGTATEINDYLRLVFTHIGHTLCNDCGVEVHADGPETVSAELFEDVPGQMVMVLSPIHYHEGTGPALLRQRLIRDGFRRVWHEGHVLKLEELSEEALGEMDDVHLVIDRVTIDPADDESAGRLAEALEQGFRRGEGRVAVDVDDEAQLRRYSRHFSCNVCGKEYPEPEHNLFSFNSPLGACPNCEGFGRVIGVDLGKVIPNPEQTIDDHPFAIWNYPSYQSSYGDLYDACARFDIPTDVPLAEMPKDKMDILLHGRDDWYGVFGFFDWLEGRRYKVHVRVMLARFRSYEPCPECDGLRLKPEALAVKVAGRTIAELCEMSIAEALAFFEQLELTEAETDRAGHLVDEVANRLGYLNDIGLSYLTLSRQTRTLSGGEALRINLATALGSSLTETLYVLDEPTVGLHPRDTGRLLGVLKALRDKGNTVVVVEHDTQIIEGADHVIDMGPGAGEHGGEVVFEGPVKKLIRSRGSLTGEHLRAMKRPPAARQKRRRPEGYMTIVGACSHNLKNLTVEIPVGVLCCVTGVSGSGKSTLIDHTFVNAYRRIKGETVSDFGRYDELIGINRVGEVVLIDQTPIGQSSRSNPVTYVKAYDEIRNLMARTSAARISGIKPSDFSFNVKGGRCDKCDGAGTLTVDMHFLADIEVECDACGGKRFKRKVLDVKYQGKNIDDILNMTVTEAMYFFRREDKVLRRLEQLDRIGLGYLRLGQSTATLSGGEAQRLKLAGQVSTGSKSKTLMFVFDEPTTGLHMADVQVLLGVLEDLIAEGHSVVVIEHNLDVIRQADWIIDLGPEGGAAGGTVVVAGPPEKVAQCEASHTGRFLVELLGKRTKKTKRVND